MTRKVVGWMRRPGWGLTLGVGVALWVWLDGQDNRAGLVALLIMVGGLIVEAGLLVVEQIHDHHQSPSVPAGARPADGVVEVWEMAGVLTRESPGSAPWKQFVGFDPTDSDPAAHPPPSRDRFTRNPPLLGRVVLISVFVGRDGRSWTDREIQAAHRGLRAVGVWVEREAIRWGASVNIGLADTFLRAIDDQNATVEVEFAPEGNDVGPMEADATTKAIAGASRVAARLGFADVVDLVARINPTIDADAHVWLWHLKQRGRSHAIPTGDRVIDGVGLAICHARESSFPEPLIGPGRIDPVTVAHEMMHLFGATDKYGVPLAGFPEGDVARSDIMRLDDIRLQHLRIGRLTAREVGWPSPRRSLKPKNPPIGEDRGAGWI